MRTYLTLIVCLVAALTARLNGELLDANCTIPFKEHLKCSIYKFSGENCSELKLQVAFPELYNTTSDFPGVPSTFEPVVVYDEVAKRALRLYLNFTPMQNVGIKYVKGFEIQYVRSDSTTTTCLIFDLSNAAWVGDAEDKKTLFHVNVGLLKQLTVYNFNLHALPKPHPPEFDTYKNITIVVPPRLDPDAPASWRASISYKKDEAEKRIAFSFNRPPAQFNFTTFVVDMKEVNKGTYIGQKKINETSYSFTDVEPGNYSIRVKPYDPYFLENDPDKCLCVQDNSCEHCVTTVTEAIEMKYIPEPTTPTTPTPTPTTTPRSPASTDKDDELDGVKVAMAVLGVVMGVSLAAVAVYVYMHRCRDRSDLYESDDSEEDKGQDNKVWDGVSKITVVNIKRGLQEKKNNNFIDANKRQVAKKLKLFLLYEEDNEFHRAVVDKFASYLQQHAHCDVMCAEWHLDAHWVQQKLETADYIIIVNSAKAYSSYTHQFAAGTPPATPSPTRDVSLGRRFSTSATSIRNKFLTEQKYDSIVMVYFDYTDKKYLIQEICPGYRYKLMKNFTEFLRHIHRIHNTEDVAEYDLPADGNHNLRPAGQELMIAITKAREYEKAHPQPSVPTVLRMESQVDSGLPDDMPENMDQRCYSDEPMDRQRQLLQYLDNSDQDVITIHPSDMRNHERPSAPSAPRTNQNPVVLSPLNINHLTPGYTQFTPTPPTATSEEYEFDFQPPDDLGDFDALSKTQSEQMRIINNTYQAYHNGGNSRDAPVVNQSGAPFVNQSGAPVQVLNQSVAREVIPERQSRGYDKDQDLVYLNMNNGDGMIPGLESEDSLSLGGQSV